MGKVPHGVLQHAAGIPVALVSGRIDHREELEQAGFHPVVEVSPRSLPLGRALRPDVAENNLFHAILTL